MRTLPSARLIREQADKFYLRFELLRAEITGEALFPWGIPLPRITPRDLLAGFANIRSWVDALELESKFGYTLEHDEIRHRQLGTQKVPIRAIFPTQTDFLRFLGKQREHDGLLALLDETRKLAPGLLGLLREKPALLADNREQWLKALAVCRFFVARPRPNLHLRALDIPGVDTKFIENNRKLLALLLDSLLPREAIDVGVTSLSGNGFEMRYGLLVEPPRIRFRLLDDVLRHRLHSVTDLQIPLPDFAALALPCEVVFVTENKTNGLAFPEYPGALVIFGLGHAIDLLSRVEWLRGKRIYYLGDLDTHGFLILSRFRKCFPHVRSLLMDRATLLGSRPYWGREEERFLGALDNLTPDECDVYDGLLEHRWGENIRLEQERIPFHQLTSALAHLPR